MKKNFILSIGLFVLAFGFIFNTNAQCPNDNIPFYFWDLTDEGETESTTCIFGGEYASLNVIEGATYEVSTCGTSFDTQVTVYDAFSGAVVGYNDDACGLQSTVSFTAASTGTVNILVDKYNCQDEYSCAELSAVLLSLPGGPQPCDNPQELACGSPLSFVLADGSGSYSPVDGPWGTPGQEAVFSFTPDENGSYAISVTNDDYYVDLFFQAGTCEAEGWTYVDDILSAASNTLDLTGGVTYYFLLDDENTTQSSGSIEVICPSEPTNPCNDLTVMTCGEEYNWSTGAGEGTLNPESGPWGTPGQEVVFAYTPESDGSYLIEMTNVGYYSDLFIGFSCTSTETAIVDFTLNMFDSWGDGWNGNAITILADGVPVLENATITDGSSGSETFSAPEGAVLTATWTTGSFTSEVSFEITNSSGAVVAGGDFGNTVDYTIPDSNGAPQASFTLNMQDSWGDGWNGSSITILADGAPVLTATLDDGSFGSETFSAPEGAVLTATWVAGSFTSEVSFELEDASGAIVAGGDFGNTIDYTIPVVTVVEDDEWFYIDDVFSASNITIELEGGVTYYFLIDDEDTAPSNGTLTVSCPCIPPAGGIDGSFAYDGDFVISGTTDGACNDCDLRTSQDRIYEISVPCAGTYNFSTCGASWDTYLLLTTAPCGGETIAFNDDDCGFQSTLTASLAAGTYYLAVEGFSSFNYGDFDLTVTGVYDLPAISAIDGPDAVCAETEAEIYTVSGAFDSYEWSTSLDATLTADAGSASVDFGANSGTISVTGTNACGTNTASIDVTVNSNPTFELYSEDALCFGDDNGSIAINPSGGLEPYTYTINGESVAEPTIVTVNASDNYIGYMNVFDNPADPCCGGGYIFGSPWALPDVMSTLDAGANTITLQPNFNTYNAADPFWSDGNEGGNKIMEANTYLENIAWNGNDVTFSGTVVSNTLADGYTAQFFIKDIDPSNGFIDAMFGEYVIDLPESGDFSVTVTGEELNDQHILQVGFTITGMNANPVNADALGSVVVTGAAVDSLFTFDGLNAGDYTIGVSDNNGCAATDELITINEPTELTLNANGCGSVYAGAGPDYGCAAISTTVAGGTPGYSFEWSNTETTEGITVCPTDTTTYVAHVTDANGCVASADWTVDVIDIACDGGPSGPTCDSPPGCTANVNMNNQSWVPQPSRVVSNGQVLCINGSGTYFGTIHVLNGGHLIVCGNVNIYGSVTIQNGGNYWHGQNTGFTGSLSVYGNEHIGTFCGGDGSSSSSSSSTVSCELSEYSSLGSSSSSSSAAQAPPGCTQYVNLNNTNWVPQPSVVVSSGQVLCIKGSGTYYGTIHVLSGGHVVVCGGVSIYGSVTIGVGGHYWHSPSTGFTGSLAVYGSEHVGTSYCGNNCTTYPSLSGSVQMCLDGTTYCVDVDEVEDRLTCGYTLGSCDDQLPEACNNSTATEEPVSCVCDGKIESMTIRWVGPSFSSANVHAKKNCNILLAALTDLMTGDEFTINASDAGLAYLRKNTFFEWAGVGNYKIPTNCCNNPVGQNFFPFEVIGWTDTEGNSCSVNSQAVTEAGEIDDKDVVTGFDGAMIKQYPNPASNNATFEFSVPTDQDVSVNILNINGQLVGTIYNGSVRANEVNKLDYSLVTLQSGIYYVHLNTPTGVLKKKFVVLK